MAWYIMRTVASMPPRSRDQGSRRWLGPFPTREDAERLWKQLIEDGTGMTDLVIEEDRLGREGPCGPVSTKKPAR